MLVNELFMALKEFSSVPESTALVTWDRLCGPLGMCEEGDEFRVWKLGIEPMELKESLAEALNTPGDLKKIKKLTRPNTSLLLIKGSIVLRVRVAGNFCTATN